MPPKKVLKPLPGQCRINFHPREHGKEDIEEDVGEEPKRKEGAERQGGATVTVAEEPKPKVGVKRSTIEGWMATNKWLICEPEKPMFCSICLKAGEKNAFTSGMVHADEFPEMVKLGHLALSSPVHTAGCERGFSAQNLILTPLRNRLTGQNQDMLLRVKLHFKEIDPIKAYNKWEKEKQRRN